MWVSNSRFLSGLESLPPLPLQGSASWSPSSSLYIMQISVLSEALMGPTKVRREVLQSQLHTLRGWEGGPEWEGTYSQYLTNGPVSGEGAGGATDGSAPNSIQGAESIQDCVP